MDRLAGDELEAFIDRLIRSRPQVSFAPDVNAKAIARKLGQAAPADVVALIRRVVNESFGNDCANQGR